MNTTSPSSTLGFGWSPHKDPCDILSEDLVSHIFQAHSSKNEGGVLRYLNKVKLRHGIGLPKTRGNQHCVVKTDFNVRAIFSQYYFSLPVLHTILHLFCLYILSFHLLDYFGGGSNKDKYL